MKIAFHFNADDKALGGDYGFPIKKQLFRVILNSRNMDIHSKVFQGDLLLHSQTVDIEKTESGEIHSFNKKSFLSAMNILLEPGSHIWHSFNNDTVGVLLTNNIFVLLFESISTKDAQKIDKELKKLDYYIGGIQVDDECIIHWAAYSNALIPSYRIIGKNIYLLWDGIDEENKDIGEVEELREIGFKDIGLESLEGRFTIFDKYANYDHARRVAELSRALSDSLAFLADHVITRISDSAPEIGNKLLSAIRTFDRAEVNEDYAQVAVTCRRTVEYVSDQLFPLQEEEVGGRKMGKNNFRNRLLAFADKERRGDTNIDLVCISTRSLSEQLEKLEKLSCKGVHTDIFRYEARRCILRTIMVLDDILSFRPGAFESKGYFDDKVLMEMLNNISKGAK